MKEKSRKFEEGLNRKFQLDIIEWVDSISRDERNSP